MFKSPYQISLWDTSTSPESKIFDIGSDTMESMARAIEPKLVRNINGKKSFSFKMYKTFADENGDHDNPYIPYLINERLVKVYWDNEWYDFVIKNVQIDSAAKVYTIQCEDWCVQELSKQGFNLEFDEKLMNNQGTITELASKVLENTNWSVDTAHTSVGYEYNKESVYEVQFSSTAFTAQQLPSFTDATIQGGRGLIFFSCVQGLPRISGQALIQFVWTDADTFETETGSIMVVNSEQYNYQVLTNYTYSNGTYTFTVGSSTFIVNTTYGTSTNYRAKRLINSIRSFYNPIVDKYCNIAKNLSGGLYTVDTSNQLYIEINNELYAIYLTTAAEAPSYYEFKDAEYNFAKYVQNLIANGSKFTGSDGWRKVNSSGMEDLVPVIDAEHVKSYLNIPVANGNDWIFNLSIKTSANFVRNFIFGEVYYLRIKLATGNQPPFTNVQIADYTSSSNYMIKSDGNTYFNGDGTWDSEGSGWYRQKLTCVKGLSLDSLIDSQVGLFFHSTEGVQLEEAQLFKEVLDESSEIITPGEFDSSGVQKMIYCAYDPEDAPETKDDIVYIYKGDEPIVKAREGYAYLTTEFQKIRTINIKESNIFNILQTLAEKFEAWCVLVLEHDESGVITSRKVKFVETIGNDSNIGFVYGLDLKGVKRTVDSKEIVTKTIVKQNSNKYADNGFCTIMRAQENFPRTNYILNFDYYVNQGLIDNEALNRALNDITTENITDVPIATFNTEESQFIKELVCGIEPVQDLNGYDNPWPAGGGKNLLNILTASGTISDVIFSANNATQSIMLNGTASSNAASNMPIGTCVLPSGTYLASIDYSISGISDYSVVRLLSGNTTIVDIPLKNSSDVSFTLESGATLKMVLRVQSGDVFQSKTIRVMVRKSSEADTSWVPYSNICPISGWTGMNVSRCGVNIWDEQWAVGRWASSNGAAQGGTAGANRIRNLNPIPVKPGMSIRGVFVNGGASNVYWYDKDGTYLGYESLTNPITVPANAYFMNWHTTSSYGETYNNDISFNIPSTDTAYHAYSGTVHPISWQTEAGTVYGGYAKVNYDGSMELTRTSGILDLGTKNWSTVGSDQSVFFYADAPSDIKPATTNAICSWFAYGSVTTSTITDNIFSITRNPYIRIRCRTYNDPATFKAAMSGVKLVYELATPQTYQLTPTEVATLLGTNNIWTDTGKVELLTVDTHRGYYVKLNEYNTAYDAAADKLEEYQLQYDQLNSYLKVYTEYKSNAESQKYTSILNLFNLDDLVGGDTSKESLMSLWNSRNDTTTAVGQWYTAHTATTGGTGKFRDAVDRDAWKYNAAVTNAIEAETKYDPQITNIETTLAELKLKIADAKSIMDTQIENIKEADIEFAELYGRFIQEGTWSSEEYMSDTLYYLDALDVAYTSARPRVTYSIDVLRLRALPGYELRRFNLGDISYVEDTEFFGYTTINGVKTPFHEPVVLTELTESFDDPSKDQFKVQNYRTQFEDLFQRITASTQTLQWNEADYGRAVSAVQKDQTINTDILQGTFNMAQDLVRSSLNNAVVQDATGISIINQDDPSKQSHIVAEGFFISTDGGVNWRNAVSAEGIATELLTAGAIDTNRISIKDGSWEAFRWDSSGLNAYKNKSTGAQDIEYGTFVRFDKYGLYGMNGAQTTFAPASEDAIWTNQYTKFALTWKGLLVKADNGTNSIVIGTDTSDSNSFGIKIKKGNTDVFGVDSNGDLNVTGKIVITSGPTYDEISSISTAVSGAASGITTEQQYCASTNSTTATGNWQSTIPETDNTHPYIFTRLKTVTTPIQGTATITYTPSENGTYDINLTNAANAAATAQTTANGAVRSTSVKTQYCLSTSESSATGDWSDTIPEWTANKYLWTRVATTITPVSGSASTTYTPSSGGAYDKNLTKALSDAASAGTAAQAAQTTANGAIKRSQRIYQRNATGITPGQNTTWLTTSESGYGTWSLSVPSMVPQGSTTKYPYLYTAVQTQDATQYAGGTGSSCSCSPVLIDDTTTVIDGGNIITGTVTANAINAGAITLQKLATDVTNTIDAAQSAADAAQNTANTAQTTATRAEGKADTAQGTANAAKTAANGAAYREQIIYRSTVSGGTAPTANETWVTDTTGGQNKWTTTRPTYSSSYPVLYIALQRQTVQQSSGTGCSCTTPQIDNTTTVIDGGHITTGTIDANRIAVSDLRAFGATIGSFTISTNAIMNGTLGGADSVIMCTGTDGYAQIGGSENIKDWAFTASNKFGVTKQGALYASSAKISGEIEATSGTIGGCTIENGSLKVSSANITGQITANAISVPNFSATSSGVSIGGFTVSSNKISSNDGNTYISSNTGDFAFRATNTLIGHNGDISTSGHLELTGVGYINFANINASIKAYGTSILQPLSTYAIKLGYPLKNYFILHNGNGGITMDINGNSYTLSVDGNGYVKAN